MTANGGDLDMIESIIRDLDLEIPDENLRNISENIGVFSKKISVLEKLEENSQIDRKYWQPVEDRYNAFLVRCSIQTSSNGQLDGISIGVKDNIAVAGLPMTCGSPIFSDFIPIHDATVVQRLLNSGAEIVGKTNMDEFALGGNSSTMRYRVGRNPHDPERHPGSSSVGSGIATAEGSADAALGTDSGGSVRCPAAWCGVVGLKPTRGLISHHGMVQYSKTLDEIGILSKKIKNVALVLDAIAGNDPKDGQTKICTSNEYIKSVESGLNTDPESLKIGLPDNMFGKAPNLDSLVLDALEDFEDFGSTLTQVSIPNVEYSIPSRLGIGITEFGAYLESHANNYWTLSRSNPHLNSEFQDRFNERKSELGEPILNSLIQYKYLKNEMGGEFYPLAQRGRSLVTKGFEKALSEVDVLASVTTLSLPPQIDEEVEDIYQVASNTSLCNLTGYPAITVPAGKIEGLPVGLQFIGEPFDEETLFQVAAHWRRIRS